MPRIYAWLALRFEPLDIGQVLSSSRRSLVLNQVLARENCHRLVSKFCEHPCPPCLSELYPVDGGENVDANRGGADLENEPSVAEIPLTQVVQRCPKGFQGLNDAPGVCSIGADPNVEVLGCPHMPVGCQCVSPHHDILNPVTVEVG